MTNTRNASLGELAEILRSDQARKIDLVAPASRLRSEGGLLVVEGSDPLLTPEGVTHGDGAYRPTEVFDDGLSTKLGIPRAYLRRLRDERSDLFDANVNGWLRGQRVLDDGYRIVDSPDPRSFLVRAFRPDDDGSTGVARAFLSDSYRIVDNLDVLTAALEGVRSAGVDVTVEKADLTDRRMYVRVRSNSVAELAPDLLRGYVSPFTGQTGADNPTVFAGFIISNSETGNGRFTITPAIEVQICANGMTFRKDALGKTHLGQKLEHGVIRWSDETLQRNLDLVTSQASDAVATFLDPDYLRAKLGQLSEGAAKPVTYPEVQQVLTGLSYGPERQEAVLDFFVSGGQVNLGGAAQAISAAAQHEPDADVAHEMESQAAELLLAA